jgi:hypothetical protein
MSDYECQNNQYCWYASPADRALNSTKCLPMYSQGAGTIFGWYAISSSGNVTTMPTIDDYTINGKYCQSGLAYPMSDTAAKCTSMTGITYNN